MYPSPTLSIAFNLLYILGIDEKKSNDLETLISNMSEIDFPLYLTSRVSLLNLFPLHTSHSTNTSGRKFISINFIPPPLQFSHLPPETLKLNLPGLYPLIFDSTVSENNFLISL